MGGQVADKGLVKDEDGNVVAEVMDVQHAPFHGIVAGFNNTYSIAIFIAKQCDRTHLLS